MDVARVVPALVGMNAAVQAVRLVGSRADGRAHDLSDWDFVVVTEEFESVASDLHGLVATLRPLGEQWDRYSSHACYMLMLAGPTKIDLLFPSEHRSWSPPWTPSPETLEAIDLHFWDWILWLEQKRRGGKGELLRKNLGDMHELMLGPMAVASEPKTVSAAIGAYVMARDELEERFGVSVPRDLEHEVRLLVERAS